MHLTKTHIISFGILMYMLLFAACERVEPDLQPGEAESLLTLPVERMFSLDTLHWEFTDKIGNFYQMKRMTPNEPNPRKGDYVVYAGSVKQFFGQLISIEASNDLLGFELQEVPVNELFTFFAYRDTLKTIGKGYEIWTDSIVQIQADTLLIQGEKLSIKEGAFLRGIIDIQQLRLFEVGGGSVFFYLTPESENSVRIRDAQIEWNQELEMEGSVIISQYDKREFADSLRLRSRTFKKSVHGFPVQIVVEDWLILDWFLPGSGTISLDFKLNGQSDFLSRYFDHQSWQVTDPAQFSVSKSDLTGWDQLKSGWVNIRYKTIVQPIFGGQSAVAATKSLSLEMQASTDWPQWSLDAFLVHQNEFATYNGVFSDLSAGYLASDEYILPALNISGELVNDHPKADFTISPPSGYTNTLFKLNAAPSSDREDAAADLQVRWDFEGDGFWDTNFSTTKLVNRQFLIAGTYDIRLQVMDTQGATADTMKQLIVYQTSSAPIASFTVSPESGKQSDLFTFDASACYDAEDPLSLLEVRWDFQNDGIWETAYSTSKAAVWIFGHPGEFVVKLEVRDSDGLTGSTTKRIVVTEGNIKPTAFFTVNPENGTTETRFSFDASESYDPEDAMEDLLVRWDFDNNGVWDTELRTVKTISHQYSVAGTYTALLEVHDTEGFSNTFSRQIQVSNPNTPPDADFTISPASGDTTTKFLFDASISTDNEDDIADLLVRWDWDNDDVYDTEFSTSKTISKQFTASGTYIIKVQVKDTGGLTDTRAKLVVVE